MSNVVNKNDLKKWLGINDNVQDDLLELIISFTEKTLKRKLGLSVNQEVPDEVSDILFNVCVKRYNRLKNEGMANYSQEGESIQFQANDFDEFTDDIKEWRVNNSTSSTLRFLNPYGGGYY